MTHTNQPGISYIFKHPASFPFLIHSDTAAQSASSSPLAAPEIELQSVIILTSPHAHIASPHTLLNKTSRKAESAFLLTNTHRMMPSLFKSVKTFLWLWRLVPVPGPFCRTDGTRCAGCWNPCASCPADLLYIQVLVWFIPHISGKCWAYLARATEGAWTDNPINSGFIFGRNQAWGMVSAVKQLTQSGPLQATSSPFPTHTGNTSHRCKKGGSGGHLWKYSSGKGLVWPSK